jgi:hypothetical protein
MANTLTTPVREIPAAQQPQVIPTPEIITAKPTIGAALANLRRTTRSALSFRANGLLLPASDSAAIRIGLPLHRGPHRDYNNLVMERVGQVEQRWSTLRAKAPEIALDEAVARITLLQRALRRRLLNPLRKPLRLNRHDPIGQNVNFAEIDAMVDMLWGETSVEIASNLAEMSLISPGEGSAARSAFSF